MTYRLGRFFNDTENRAKQQATQMAKMQTSMRWMTAAGRYGGTKPICIALVRSIQAPIPTPKKLSALNSSIVGDRIFDSGSDGDKCASEIAPESTTVLKRNSSPRIMATAPKFVSHRQYKTATNAK